MNSLTPNDHIDFRLLYNKAPCGLLTYHINGKIIHINQTLLNWIGLPEEKVMEMEFIELLDRGGRLYYQLFVYPLLRMQNEAREINFQIETPNASFSCLYNALSTRMSSEQETVIHATIFHVDDRKKYESELLRRKTMAEEEKLQKIKALEKVAFYQSHLVRAPLANILGIADLLSADEINSNISDLIPLLKQSAEQLDSVIRKIVEEAGA